MTGPTPITDRLERRIEAEDRRDVPTRVYQHMRVLEDERNELAAALRKVVAAYADVLRSDYTTSKNPDPVTGDEAIRAAMSVLAGLTE